MNNEMTAGSSCTSEIETWMSIIAKFHVMIITCSDRNKVVANKVQASGIKRALHRAWSLNV